MSETMLEVTGLEKRFPRAGGDVQVLCGCDLSMAESESVAIMGASGAGKSTFLNILGGLDSPDTGVIAYRGQPVELDSVVAAIRWRAEVVGFVFQFHFLLPDFTARENLLLPVRARGRVRDQDRERADRLLEALELTDRADHLPAELSGGQSQRVAVARAFMNRPRLLLADEPFGNLDRAISDRLADLLFHLCRQDSVAMVLVTHDPALARRANRTLHLVDGQLFAGDGGSVS